METGIIGINKDLILEYIDPALKNYIEIGDTFIGKKISEIPEFSRDDILASIKRLTKGRAIIRRIKRDKNGKNIILQMVGKPLLDEKGKIQRALIILQDITKLEEKYNLLTQTKNNFIRFIDYLPLGIIVTDTEKHILFSNTTAQKILKTSSEDFIKLPRKLNIQPGNKKEILFTGSHGEQKHLEVDVRTIKWYREDSKLFTLRDITPLILAEQQNSILLAAIQSTVNAIVITNHEMFIDWANPAFTKLTGWKTEEVINKKISDLLNVDEQTDKSIFKNIENIIANDKILQTEVVRPRKDGTYLNIELTISPFYDHNTGNRRYIFIFNDLTKRKEKENIISILNKVFISIEKASGLKESFMILQNELLKNHIRSVFYYFNKEKRILVPKYYSFDQKALDRFAELSGKDFVSLQIPIETNEKYKQIIYNKKTIFSDSVSKDLMEIISLPSRLSVSLTRLLGIHNSIMTPVTGKNNEIFGVFQLFSNHLTENNIPDVIAFSNHLSFLLQKTQMLEELKNNYEKLKKNYKKLEASRKQYKDLFDNDLTGDYISTPGGKFLNCNRAFVKIMGYNSKEEILNLNPEVLYPDPKKRSEIFETLKKNKKIVNHEIKLIRKDGKRICVLLNAYGVFDNKGQLTQSVGYIFDITKRKQYEIELIRAKEKAEESSRLKTSFLANMSHEIRTPLNAIMGFSELLQNEALSPEERKEYTGIIRSAGLQLMGTIGGILELSRIEAGEINIKKESVDLNILFHEIEIQYSKNKMLLEKKLDLHLEIPDEENKIIVSDREKLLEILQNLLENAIKYTSRGTIGFGYKIKDRDHLELFVKDTGIGIKPENIERIFHRFQQEDNTLTRKYEGIGLGLAITRNLVHLLHGEIRVESTPGKGSTFYVKLPMAT